MRAARGSFLTAAIVLAIGMVSAGAGAYMCLPYWARHGQTRFAPGFSDFRFQLLTEGQSMESVFKILGKPLRQEVRPRVNAWIYVPSENVAAARLQAIPDDQVRYFTDSTTIVFDDSDRVMMALGSFLQPAPSVGMTQGEVRTLYDLPASIVRRPRLIEQSYSEPAGTSAASPWKTRRIYYEENRRLLATVGYTVFPGATGIVSFNPFFPMDHIRPLDLYCYPSYCLAECGVLDMAGHRRFLNASFPLAKAGNGQGDSQK